jgi:hypothetical protein
VKALTLKILTTKGKYPNPDLFATLALKFTPRFDSRSIIAMRNVLKVDDIDS